VAPEIAAQPIVILIRGKDVDRDKLWATLMQRNQTIPVLVHCLYNTPESGRIMEACMRTTRWLLATGLLVGLTGLVSAQGPEGAEKVCAPFVPNVWRTVTPVPGTWSLDDCRTMAGAIGAAAFQVACSFEMEPPGQISKFIMGAPSPMDSPPSAANLPSPNCGW
jgi:hypothetical protein